MLYKYKIFNIINLHKLTYNISIKYLHIHKYSTREVYKIQQYITYIMYNNINLYILM